MGKQKKQAAKPSKNNSAAPMDKAGEASGAQGLTRDTRVVHAEEHNRNDG